MECSCHRNTPFPVSKETCRAVRSSQAAWRKLAPAMDKTGRRNSVGCSGVFPFSLVLAQIEM